MAIAGSTVPCSVVSVQKGKLREGSGGRAIKEIVYDDVDRAVEAVMSGKMIYLELAGDNLPRFRTAVAARLGLPTFK